MTTLYTLAFCRIVVGLVFMISSGSKLLQFRAFIRTLARFSLLPAQVTTFAALLVVSSEIVVTLFTALGGQFLLPGFVLASTLLILFSGALLSVLVRRISTSCNCFGPGEKEISPSDIWRNLGFLLCAFAGCACIILGQRVVEEPGRIAWILLGLSALVFVVIWTQLGELARLLRL